MTTDPDFEALLVYLQQSHGFDLTGYKRPSLMRRVSLRMAKVEVATFSDYLDYLQVHPDEFAPLFDTLLINVTAFFRDAPAWAHLQKDLLPQIAAAREDEPMRLWSAGCASGEEAYTLAMVVAEVMGEDALRHHTKIYATDVDEAALTKARHGVYTTHEVAGVPPELLAKYFEGKGDQRAFRADLRRSIIFGRHDLTQDAPISRVDVLACRNVLMYFNAELQRRILTRLHYAVRSGGVLMLGKAEMLLSQGSLFTPIDLRNRVFVKSDSPARRAVELPEHPTAGDRDVWRGRLQELAVRSLSHPYLFVDSEGRVAGASTTAVRLFGLSTGDIDRPLQDLEVSYRPVELRSCIEEAARTRQPVRRLDVRWQPPGGESVLTFDVIVMPLVDAVGDWVGSGIVFQDVTRFGDMQQELVRFRQELETAYEELQSTNEELESANEELQSTVEELQTTNEELESANEELQTTNEELQSSNDELQSLNTELAHRTGELDRTSSFLESVLDSLGLGMVVVDPGLVVQAWNPRAEDLWGVRASEAIGRPLGALDIGLPVDELGEFLMACMEGRRPDGDLRIEAVNRRGRTIRCRIMARPLEDRGDGVRGAVVLFESVG